MKWIYNHVEIVWAIFVVWFISFFIVCECLSPARDYMVAFLVLLGIGIILFTILIRYYLYHPKGREAVRMAEEIRREKEQRRRELYEELDRKYKGVELPDELLYPPRNPYDDTGCSGMVF